MIRLFYKFSTDNIFKRADMYIMQYHNLSSRVKQQEQQLNKLRKKVAILENISQITLQDQIKSLVYKIIGSKYQSSKIIQQRQKLIQYRKDLQKAIDNAQKKWEQPRKLIIQARENVINNFLKDILLIEKELSQLKQYQYSDQSIKEGLELSHRYLINTLIKEQVQPINPNQNQEFNRDDHKIVEGTGKLIDSVICKGWRIKGQIHEKAQIKVKQK